MHRILLSRREEIKKNRYSTSGDEEFFGVIMGIFDFFMKNKNSAQFYCLIYLLGDGLRNSYEE